MKTKQYTTAMLIAMIFATASIQGQTARRPVTKETKERTTQKQTVQTKQPVRHVQTKQVQQRQRTTQPARQVQTKQVRQVQTKQVRQVQTKQVQQRQRTTQPARQVQTKQVQQRQRTTQPVRQAQINPVQRQRTVQNSNKNVSITTGHNPKSNYRKPDYKVYNGHYSHNKANKYAAKRYYGGHHYHYAYPTKKAKFYYHHETYLHNYNVLYYPTYTNTYWNRSMYRNYRRWYPEFNWSYNYGHRINTISVFDAKYNLGEVATVYGRVYATWHNEETGDYLLFFGGDFPYQQFTVVLPERIARKFSWRPERYFLGEHITITGLITTFDGNPEILVKDKHQMGIY